MRDPLLCLCCFLVLFPHPIPQLVSSRAWFGGRGRAAQERADAVGLSSVSHAIGEATAAFSLHVPAARGTCDLRHSSRLSYCSKPFIIWLQLTFTGFCPSPYFMLCTPAGLVVLCQSPLVHFSLSALRSLPTCMLPIFF